MCTFLIIGNLIVTCVAFIVVAFVALYIRWWIRYFFPKKGKIEHFIYLRLNFLASRFEQSNLPAIGSRQIPAINCKLIELSKMRCRQMKQYANSQKYRKFNVLHAIKCRTVLGNFYARFLNKNDTIDMKSLIINTYKS